MKFLFDLLPVLLFFVAFKAAGSFPAQAQAIAGALLAPLSVALLQASQVPILLATAVAVLATVLQVGWLLVRGRRVEPMLWISFAVIVLFGGATIALQDETFIKWKPTILYWTFAAIIGGAALMGRRNVMRALLGGSLHLPEQVWQQLNWAWALFFAGAGALNLWVAFTLPTATWVNFKVFGLFGLTLVFALAIGAWIARHMKEEPNERQP